MPLLEARGLCKTFDLGRGRRVRAVSDVSFALGGREILGLVGESGCGKSTLARLVMRLLPPTAGEVVYHGKANAQMIFQNPFASFNPKLRVSSALMEVCRFYGMKPDAARGRIEELFAGIGLSTDLLGRWPADLSGGQLQRLAIARALLSGPEILVADEPVSALDVSVQAQLLNLLADLRAGCSMLFISHDMAVVEYLCDRVAVMYLGRIVETAGKDELFTRTLHPYTRSLVAAAPRMEPRTGPAAPLLRGEAAAGAVDGGCAFAPRCPQAAPRCRAGVPAPREAAPGHWVWCHKPG